MPEAGTSSTEESLDRALGELEQALSSLPEESAVALPRASQRDLALAIDRCGDRLRRDGVTDFLINSGDAQLARGSQAPGRTRGWSVIPKGFPEPPREVLTLSGEAAFTVAEEDSVTTAIAASTGAAQAAAERLAAGQSLDDLEAAGPRIHYRRWQEDGNLSESDGFAERTNPVSAKAE